MVKLKHMKRPHWFKDSFFEIPQFKDEYQHLIHCYDELQCAEVNGAWNEAAKKYTEQCQKLFVMCGGKL